MRAYGAPHRRSGTRWHPGDWRGTLVSMSVVAVLVGAFLAAAPALAAPPSNDDSSGAVVVTTLPFAIDIDMAEATAGPDDPPSCPGGPSGMATVWYRLEPTFATARWIEVRAASVDTTTRALTVATPGGTLLGTCDFDSQWILVQPGQTPWVVVQAVVPPGGPASVALQIGAASPPPANDRSAGAVVVSSFPFVDDVDVAGATHSANDPRSAAGPSSSRASARPRPRGTGSTIRMRTPTGSASGSTDRSTTGSGWSRAPGWRGHHLRRRPDR